MELSDVPAEYVTPTFCGARVFVGEPPAVSVDENGGIGSLSDALQKLTEQSSSRRWVTEIPVSQEFYDHYRLTRYQHSLRSAQAP